MILRGFALARSEGLQFCTELGFSGAGNGDFHSTEGNIMTLNFAKGARIGLCLTAGISALAISSPALAQDADAPEDEDSYLEEGEIPDPLESGAPNNIITVTGSRIQRPNQQSTAPIVTLQLEEILSTGEVNIGDALNDLPSLRSTFSQANSTRFIGTAGLN
ncbi:MAG: hypothetical protein WA918_03460, partial [Erythrobacter sp.]